MLIIIGLLTPSYLALMQFYLDDGLAIIAATVPRIIPTHQNLSTTNAISWSEVPMLIT